ncbi:hypothetical protein N665_0673s0002 [Sinapis alba]|nr:hypothetical protein N665_0673s0002 [Sinapis alba]
MLDQVLEGQHKLMVDFNGKIDSVYTNLNIKFETLSTQVKKLEMQVVQTGEATKRFSWIVHIHEDYDSRGICSKAPTSTQPFYGNIDRCQEPVINRQREFPDDRHTPVHIDRREPLKIRVQLPKIDVARLHALRNPSIPSDNPPDTAHPKDAPEPMKVDNATEGRILRKRRENIPKHLKRIPNEKEMDGFTERVLKISHDKPFEEAYFTHMLWMFFRETRETEEDIRRIFHQVRDKMKQRITLKKKSDPEKFTIPCLVHGIEFPRALCDTGASVSILPKVMADHLSLKIEPSEDAFSFVDCSERNSGGIIRDLVVQISNALVVVYFHVLDIKLNWNTSLLLGRAFLATVGAICNMQTNKTCLTLIDPTTFYDPISVVKTHVPSVETGDDHIFIATCYCGVENDSELEYETEYVESIVDTIDTSIDRRENESIDRNTQESIDSPYTKEHDDWPTHYYPSFTLGAAVSSQHLDEYDEDYKEERAT